ELLQQTGDTVPQPLQRRYDELGVSATLVPFLDDMCDAYAWAHVAIARAGASTLAELATVGLPAAIVPLADAAKDHQAANARQWARAGAGPAPLEHEWSSELLADWLRTMTVDRDRWRLASERALSLARTDAAQRLVDDCYERARREW